MLCWCKHQSESPSLTTMNELNLWPYKTSLTWSSSPRSRLWRQEWFNEFPVAFLTSASSWEDWKFVPAGIQHWLTDQSDQQRFTTVFHWVSLKLLSSLAFITPDLTHLMSQSWMTLTAHIIVRQANVFWFTLIRTPLWYCPPLMRPCEE